MSQCRNCGTDTALDDSGLCPNCCQNSARNRDTELVRDLQQWLEDRLLSIHDVPGGFGIFYRDVIIHQTQSIGHDDVK